MRVRIFGNPARTYRLKRNGTPLIVIAGSSTKYVSWMAAVHDAIRLKAAKLSLKRSTGPLIRDNIDRVHLWGYIS